MAFPLTTSIYAALLGLLFAALSFWVSAARRRYGVDLGDGGHADLLGRIRAHGNFAEFVPLILILAMLLEARRTSVFLIHLLLLPLLIARLSHPVGLAAPSGSARHQLFRRLGAGVTYGVLIAASLLLLFEGLTTPHY